MKDLQSYIENAEGETLALVKSPGRGRLEWITQDVLNAARELYPSATINDLLSALVWTLLRTPA